MTLAGFEQKQFTHDGKTKDVYWRGDGPGVVIVHEIPGITPDVADFGRRVADAGFTAVLSHLFGTPNKPPSGGYLLGQLARACISREFFVLAQKKSSPITNWLRGLCRDVHQQRGGPGVGALGMCLTGGFALSLMLDESVMAPVLSQPSLPFPVSANHKAAVALSDAELARVKERAAAGCSVLGLRFTNDISVPPERFETLRRELGKGFEDIEIDSSPGNPHNIPQSAHSVLTTEFVDEAGHPTLAAYERVIAFFNERLKS
ncbi:MAG: dienelactone hydrolase family protein [Chloroflexota bacterium]